jgi:hypothetical protein
VDYKIKYFIKMKRTYITHATENYLDVVLNLAKSLSLFSEIPLIVYFIDSNKEVVEEKTKGFSNLSARYISLGLEKTSEKDYIFSESGNYYAERLNPKIYSILCGKTIAMEMALDEGWEEVCYLDSDCLATPLVDEIFQWSNSIEDYPLATQGIHEYMIIIKDGKQLGNPFEFSWPAPDHKLCLEWPLMSFLELTPDRRGTYRTTNVMLANQNCKSFISTWKDLCYLLPRIVDTNRCAPYHEETVYNVLSWKKTNIGIPLCYINLGEGLETVKHFYSDEAKEGTLRWSETDYSQNFYLIPDDKRNTKVLHGEKRTSEVELILEYLKNKNIK